MKGLQRKCFIASASFHGLLLLLVVVGSAFVSRKAPEEAPSFDLFDAHAILVDQPNVLSGGNPNVTTPPQAAPQQPAQPAQQPAAPPVQESKPEPKPELPKTEPKAAPKAAAEEKPQEPAREPEPKVEQPKVEQPKPKIDPDSFDLSKAVKKTVQGKTDKSDKPSTSFDFGKAEKRTIKPSSTSKDGKESSDGDEKGRADRERQMAMARAGAVADALRHVQGGLSSVGGSYEIPGPGGPAYASYYLALRKFYETAWIPPTAGRGDEPVVEVEVVIARDGTILSQRITKKSGRRELDNSIQNTLNRVYKAKAPRFPEGSTDEKRTFRINFNLTEKLSVG